MNNYILVNITYADTTPKSAEFGDFSDTGVLSIDEQYTFRELVNAFKNCYREPSNSPNNGDINTWYSVYFTHDYAKGIEREESIHFSHLNTANANKYWKLAAKYAGLLTQKTLSNG